MQSVLSKSRHFVALVFLTALPLVAHGQRSGSAAPPEVRKTVDAFVGHWDLTGSYTEPHSKTPSHLIVTLDCEPAALGMAVNCRMTSADTRGGHGEMASVIGYSPDEQLVRLMEISSSGSYHDHKGRWSGNVIQFDLLAYSVAGKQIVETFSIGFPSPGKMTIKSIEETSQGKSTMNLVGTKRSKGR